MINKTDAIRAKYEDPVIIGYGPEREMYQIRLDAILYFEAVGENVFAYTKNNVYEIKQRLYKIEETVKDSGFVRASKSLVVNLRCINCIAPSDGGRGKITMSNDESVIASRGYMKDLVNSFKNRDFILSFKYWVKVPMFNNEMAQAVGQ